MRTVLLAPALAVLLTLVCPSLASAGVVELIPHLAQDRYQSSFGVVSFVADAGEANVTERRLLRRRATEDAAWRRYQ